MILPFELENSTFGAIVSINNDKTKSFTMTKTELLYPKNVGHR